MELEGTVSGGMIVPDEGIDAPDGTRVRFEAYLLPGVNPTEPDTSNISFAEVMAEFCGATKNLPDDYALNHEHYPHGTPNPAIREADGKPNLTLAELLKDFNGVVEDLPSDYSVPLDSYLYSTPKR